MLIFRPNAIKFGKEMKKGDRVSIEGTLSYKQVESKDGRKLNQALIIASFIAKSPIPEKDEE